MIADTRQTSIMVCDTVSCQGKVFISSMEMTAVKEREQSIKRITSMKCVAQMFQDINRLMRGIGYGKRMAHVPKLIV